MNKEILELEKFNLDQAMSGARVVTRDGRNVRIVCFDAPTKNYPIYGFIEGNDNITKWHIDGKFCNLELNDLYDLFIVSEKTN